MTKDELIDAMDGIPGNTELMLWDDATESAVSAYARMAVFYPKSVFVMPAYKQVFRNVKIPEGSTPAVIVVRGDSR